MEPGKKIYIIPRIFKGIMYSSILGSFAIRINFLLKLFKIFKKNNKQHCTEWNTKNLLHSHTRPIWQQQEFIRVGE